MEQYVKYSQSLKKFATNSADWMLCKLYLTNMLYETIPIHILNSTFVPYIILGSSVWADIFRVKFFSLKSSVKISSSMHVRCIVKSHNFPLILTLFFDLLIKILPIILFNPFLLALPLCTSVYPSCNMFLPKHSVSLGPSIWGKNLTLTLMQKPVRYHLNNYCRFTVDLGMERILISLDKVVFEWAVHVAVVQLSSGRMWTTSILFCMYLLSVTVCAAIYR